MLQTTFDELDYVGALDPNQKEHDQRCTSVPSSEHNSQFNQTKPKLLPQYMGKSPSGQHIKQKTGGKKGNQSKYRISWNK